MSQNRLQPEIDLKVTALDSVSFASALNDSPLVREIAVTNLGAEMSHELSISITMPPYFKTWKGTVPQLPPNATFQIEDITLEYALEYLRREYTKPTALLHISLSQTVSEDKSPLSIDYSQEVVILGPQDWNGDSDPLLLAPLIYPNDPALEKVLSYADQRFKVLSDNQDALGYKHQDPELVKYMAQAIFAAIGDLSITITPAPAHFDQHGQRVQTPTETLKLRTGTSLDITALIVATLERQGLYPLIFMVQGSAFPGVWLNPTFKSVGILHDNSKLLFDVKIGTLCAFDSVAACASASFENAKSEARAYLDEGVTFRFALDLQGARVRNYLPLPLDENPPLNLAPPPIPETPEPVKASETSELTPELKKANEQLSRWQTELLDLSLRNRLLNFNPERHGMCILCADLLRFEDLLAGERTFSLDGIPEGMFHSPAKSSRLALAQEGSAENPHFFRDSLNKSKLYGDLPGELIETRLKLLDRKSRESFEEAGAHTLFLAFGLLRWLEQPSSKNPRLAPIVLVPITLMRPTTRGTWKLKFSDEPTVFNPSLIEKLRADFGIDLSQYIEDIPIDDSGSNLSSIFARVRQAIEGIAGWGIEEEVHLGYFYFTKQVMWRDLERLKGQLSQSPILKSLASRGLERFPTGARVPSEDDLDDQFPPAQVFCPLDTDASQLVAILAAAEGESFVLQGPPGTGKSQTITNLITHCLSLGKKVLFVAAKMAALQVVYKRLEQCEVGAYCLELHSHSANKKSVLAQMGRSFEPTAGTETQTTWETQTEKVLKDRKHLNDYVRSLHRERAFGQTLREGIAQLVEAKQVASVSLPFPSIETMTAADLQTRLEALALLAKRAQKIDAISGHALRLLRATESTPIFRGRFEELTRTTQRTLVRVAEASEIAQKSLDIEPQEVPLTELELLAEVLLIINQAQDPSPQMIIAQDPGSFYGSALDLVVLVRQRDQLFKALGSHYQVNFLQLDLELIAATLSKWYSAAKPIAWLMLFSTKKRLKALRIGKDLPNLADLISDVASARTYQSLVTQIEADPLYPILFCPDGKTPRSADEVENQILEAETVRKALERIQTEKVLSSGGIKARLLAATQVTDAAERDRLKEKTGKAAQVLNTMIGELRKDTTNLAELGQIQFDQLWGAMTSASDLNTQLDQFTQALGGLLDWCRYQSSRRQVEGLPEITLVEEVERGELQPDQLEPIFKRAYLQTWLEAELNPDEAMSGFDSATHEQILNRFQILDRQIGKAAGQAAKRILADRIPKGEDGEMGVLYRELQKKTRHLSIRKLFEKIPTVRERLKPCLLMSPLSVAQYLSPEERFDIVVFDEASQIPTADAVGAAPRGKQLIVVGDSKQLPPTTFFARRNDDEDDDTDEEPDGELESILNECLALRLRELPLRWHYRSQHEHLIAFSNSYYYNKRLYTFPSADNLKGRLGVSLVHIPDGIYSKGKNRTNPIEATAVVAEVVRRLKDPEERQRSLGIVTFSMAQQRLVEDFLENERLQQPDLEAYLGSNLNEPLFVKNLENVQGDERDVILFSICYGPDEAGKVSMNFGPLNQEGGERRLNVAVTRARQQLVVFSSLLPTMIDMRRTNALGVKHLRHFLEYAMRGPIALAGAMTLQGNTRFDSPFEEQIYQALTERGHDILTQVGCSGYRIDLAVADPDEPGRLILGIECDGAAYHSSKTARDRDRLRQGVLTALGWKLFRVWSLDWWDNPSRVIDEIEAAITQEKARPLARSLLGANADRTSNPDQNEANEQLALALGTDPEPLDLARNGSDSQELKDSSSASPGPLSAEKIGEPYQWVQLRPPPGSPQNQDSSKAQLTADLDKILTLEAPIHRRILFKRLEQVWNVTPVTQSLINTIENIIVGHLGFKLDEFYWKAGMDPDSYTLVRYATEAIETQRKIEDVALEELMACAVLVLHENGRLGELELPRSIAKAFGFARTTSKVSERIKLALGRLLDKGVVQAIVSEAPGQTKTTHYTTQAP